MISAALDLSFRGKNEKCSPREVRSDLIFFILLEIRRKRSNDTLGAAGRGSCAI